MGEIDPVASAATDAEAIFVEILDRHDDVASRHRVERLPARIGRAYSNDIIVDDPFLAPHHAEIRREPSGALVVIDLGTRNGLHPARSRSRVERIEAQPEAQWRAGRTNFRLRPASFTVPAERSDDAPVRPMSGWALLAAVLVMVAVSVVSEIVGTAEYLETSRISSAVLRLVLMMVAWAAMWSFATRLLVGRWNFVSHATVTCIAIFALIVADVVFEYTAFAFSLPLLDSAGLLGAGLIAAWLLFRHLQLFGRMSRRVAGVVAVAVVGFGVGTAQLADYANSLDNVSRLGFFGHLKPAEARLARPISAEAFFARAGKLKAPLEQDRLKR